MSDEQRQWLTMLTLQYGNKCVEWRNAIRDKKPDDEIGTLNSYLNALETLLRAEGLPTPGGTR